MPRPVFRVKTVGSLLRHRSERTLLLDLELCDGKKELSVRDMKLCLCVQTFCGTEKYEVNVFTVFCIWNMRNGILFQTVLFSRNAWPCVRRQALPALATSRTTPQTHGGTSLKTWIVEPLLRVASRPEGVRTVLVGRRVSLRYVSRHLKTIKDATLECAVKAALVYLRDVIRRGHGLHVRVCSWSAVWKLNIPLRIKPLKIRITRNCI